MCRAPIRVLLTSALVGVTCSVITFIALDAVQSGPLYRMIPLGYESTAPESNISKQVREASSMMAEELEVGSHLQQEVRVLVWVMTQPANHDSKAMAIKETWGTRVNKLLFMSTIEDSSLPTVDLKVKEGRENLWAKTTGAFKHIYEHHINDSDWFMKSDDDTFVVVENLRYMLSPYDPNTPIYFGSRFKKYVPQGYMSGGGGYVLSRAAVILFVEKALPNPSFCNLKSKGAEDVEMGKCLNNIGVLAGDSRDSLGKGRFFPFIPMHHLIPRLIGKDSWYWDYIYYPMKAGPDCCSNTAVTFHYINADKMREMDYLIYHLRPFGLLSPERFPSPLPPDHSSIPDKVLERYATTVAR